MANKIIDLGARLKTAFGFTTPNESSTLEALGFNKKNEISGSGVFVKNNYSFEKLTLKGNGFDLTFGAMMNTPELSPDTFAPPPMISWKKGKNITITPIDGTDAEVVERYGDKSWEIKIQGLLIDMVNHNYPSSQVKLLRELFEVPAPFGVEAEIFDDLGIKSIYFTDAEFAGVAGYEDTIQYTLEARSIKPVEFFLLKTSV